MVQEGRVPASPVRVEVGERAPDAVTPRERVEIPHGGTEDHRAAAPAAHLAVTAEHANLKRLRDGPSGARPHRWCYDSARHVGPCETATPMSKLGRPKWSKE